MDSPSKVIIARRIYAGKHIRSATPSATEDPLPKARIFDKAARYAKANGLDEHPYFKGKVNRFASFCRNNWGGKFGIRRYAAETNGEFYDLGHGLRGIRRAGKKGAEATAEWEGRVALGIAEPQKIIARHARRMLKAECPEIQLKLLMP